MVLVLMQSDLEEQSNEVRAAEENSKRAMSDAARLAEELRHEQDHAGQIEKLRRALEAQVKDMQVGSIHRTSLHHGTELGNFCLNRLAMGCPTRDAIIFQFLSSRVSKTLYCYWSFKLNRAI